MHYFLGEFLEPNTKIDLFELCNIVLGLEGVTLIS